MFPEHVSQNADLYKPASQIQRLGELKATNSCAVKMTDRARCKRKCNLSSGCGSRTFSKEFIMRICVARRTIAPAKVDENG